VSALHREFHARQYANKASLIKNEEKQIHGNLHQFREMDVYETFEDPKRIFRSRKSGENRQ
jgi:hypothetical protein